MRAVIWFGPLGSRKLVEKFILGVASYNNYYGNTVHGILGGRVRELIMDIAMSDKC